jgi:hypothetical protein
MDDFPPDLSRLGEELASAIDRSLRRQRLRRRLVDRAVKLGMFGALIFVAMTPAVLQPASVGIEEEQRMVSGPDDADTVAQLCQAAPGKPVPMCNATPQVTVASVDTRGDGRIRPRRLLGFTEPSAAP